MIIRISGLLELPIAKTRVSIQLLYYEEAVEGKVYNYKADNSLVYIMN